MYSHLLPKSGSTRTKSFKIRAIFAIEVYQIVAIANTVKAISVTGIYNPKYIGAIGNLIEWDPT